jgi:hypothetical protein
VETLGELIRVSTALATARAYILSGILSALEMIAFVGVILLASSDPAGEIERAGGLCGVALGLFLLVPFGWTRLRIRVWVFKEGLVYRTATRRTVLKWSEVKWVITSVGSAAFTGDRNTELGIRGGRSVLLPRELDDPDDLAECVVELAHRNLYPRLLDAVNREREIRFGSISLCARGIRRRGEDMTPWSRIGQIGLMWGTHVAVMRRDLPAAWATISVRDMPNAWLFLWLTKVLHPLQTSPNTLDRPWLRSPKDVKF